MPVTVCWSAKGGSGTTVVAAALALSRPTPCLLVDADGELPAVLGLPEPDGQGLADWLLSDAPATTVADLALEVDRSTRLVPRGRGPIDPGHPRWPELADWLAGDDAVVDAGTGPPPAGLFAAGARSLLVTRSCYLALRRTAALPCRPDGVVLVLEPGRALGPADVARAVGAPVVATVSVDPAVARAVDAGLLTARVPRGLRRELLGAGPSPLRRRSLVAVGRPQLATWVRGPHGPGVA